MSFRPSVFYPVQYEAINDNEMIADSFNKASMDGVF